MHSRRIVRPSMFCFVAAIAVGALPAQAETLPAQAGTLPAQAETLPAQAEMLPAQARALPAQDGPAIARALAAFVATPALAGARVGVEVVDLDGGAVVCAHDADKGFLTASNMKLVSAAVALKTLGADFRWTTTVVAPQANGDSLEAAVWLVGSGDPSLGGPPAADATAPMQELARQLFAAGVRRVRGEVIGDGSCHEMGPFGSGWQWDYLGDDYAAPCSGLNFAGNVATLVVTPGSAPGEPASVRCEPERAVQAWSAARTVAAGEPAELVVACDDRREALQVRGTIAVGAGPQRLAVPVLQPEWCAAQALARALVAAGIEVKQEPYLGGWKPGRDAKALASVQSPPLAEVLVPMLKRSINLYAEQCWRTAAVRASSARTSADCERQCKQVLAQLGVPTDGMVVADGSGLSRRNLVQPRQLTALLRAIHSDPQLAAIRPALPIAGVDGTIARRLLGPATKGHVHAKTGFVSYVACLSGYVDRPDGRPPFAFAVMVNNFTCETAAAKDAIDAFVTELCLLAGWRG